METTLSSNEILGQVKIIVRQLYIRSPEDLLDSEETEFLNQSQTLHRGGHREPSARECLHSSYFEKHGNVKE